MNLRTLDEARTTIARSALRVLERCDNTDPHTITAMLHGTDQPTLSAHDHTLTQRHRRILDHVTTLGYASEIDDELDGITSAAGLDDTHPHDRRPLNFSRVA